MVAKLCIAMARPPRHRIELSEEERASWSGVRGRRSCRFRMCSARGSCSMRRRGCRTRRSRRRLDTTAGIVGKWRRRFFDDRLEGLKDKPRAGRPRRFPPAAGRRGQGDRVRAAGHARPAAGRFSRVELHRLVIERGVTDASASTIWRWLHEDAIKPWQTRSWIFPRDPHFAEKAGRVLDLYARVFEGRRLRPDEYVICADEKSQLQALGRRHETVPAGPGRPAWSSSSTAAAARSPTSPPGTCTTPTCSTASRPRPGSSRSAGSSTRS